MSSASASATARPSRLPGDLAIWVFILAEMLAFAVFFASYAFARTKNVEMFNLYQQTLDRNAGALNTLLLVTGSWFVVLAVQAAHRDDRAGVPRNIALGFLCGGGFLIVKVVEYAAKFGAGISLSTNTFYMFYISLTFFHFMHVILGMVILAILWVQARKGAYGSHDAHGLESGEVDLHQLGHARLGDVLLGLGVDDIAVQQKAHRRVGVDQFAGLEHDFVEAAVGRLLDRVDGLTAEKGVQILPDGGLVVGEGAAGDEQQGEGEGAERGRLHPGNLRVRADDRQKRPAMA